MRAVRSLVVLVCLLVASSALAQEGGAMLTTLTRVDRDGATQTTSIRVPADFYVTKDVIFAELDMDETLLDDPRVRIQVNVYVLNPTKGMWQIIRGYGFGGFGRYVDPDTGAINPSLMEVSGLTTYLGQEIRFEVVPNRRVPVGILIYDYKLPPTFSNDWRPIRPTADPEIRR